MLPLTLGVNFLLPLTNSKRLNVFYAVNFLSMLTDLAYYRQE